MSRLFLAAHRNDTEALAKLLEEPDALGASDSRGWTALHFAADTGALEATQPLLSPEAAPAKPAAKAPLIRKRQP